MSKHYLIEAHIAKLLRSAKMLMSIDIVHRAADGDVVWFCCVFSACGSLSPRTLSDLVVGLRMSGFAHGSKDGNMQTWNDRDGGACWRAVHATQKGCLVARGRNWSTQTCFQESPLTNS